MSRGLSGLLAVLVLVSVPLPVSQAQDVDRSPHAPPVLDARHDPTRPGRGQDVQVTVDLDPSVHVVSVTMLYCRAENYACAPPVPMQPTPGAAYAATIPWRAGFFGSVENVGYSVAVEDEAGNVTSSPVMSWPYRPDSLPASAADYYFYALPAEEEELPGPAWTLLVAVMWLGGVWAGRRHR